MGLSPGQKEFLILGNAAANRKGQVGSAPPQEEVQIQAGSPPGSPAAELGTGTSVRSWPHLYSPAHVPGPSPTQKWGWGLNSSIFSVFHMCNPWHFHDLSLSQLSYMLNPGIFPLVGDA